MMRTMLVAYLHYFYTNDWLDLLIYVTYVSPPTEKPFA
jgi:hypothetical protein